MQRTITIGKSNPKIYDVLQSIKQQELDPSVKEDIIVINFKGIKFIGIAQISLLNIYLLEEQTRSKNLNIKFKNLEENLNRYLSRINFFKNLKINNEENFTRWNETGRFTTLKIVDNESQYSALDEIIEIVDRNNELTPDIKSMLYWSFGEIIDNVFEHSKAEICIVMAQTYPNKGTVDICVVDNGIGINRSLKEFTIEGKEIDIDIENKTVSEIIKEATKKNVTRGSGQGNGLYYTKKFVELNKGNMNIYSNEGRFLVSKGKYNKGLSIDLLPWGGTLVHLTINKDDKQLDLPSLFGVDVNNRNEIYQLPSWYLEDERVVIEDLDSLW